MNKCNINILQVYVNLKRIKEQPLRVIRYIGSVRSLIRACEPIDQVLALRR